jgi:transposase-like protein
MDPRIEELRHTIAAERSSWPGRRWRASQTLRARVVATVEDERAQGRSLGHIAVALGLHISVLRRWLRRRASESTAAPTFRHVTLRAPGWPSTSGLVLVTPGGFRLEGLDLPTALTLLQAVA